LAAEKPQKKGRPKTCLSHELKKENKIIGVGVGVGVDWLKRPRFSAAGAEGRRLLTAHICRMTCTAFVSIVEESVLSHLGL
jgi:hypothetical protein